jgi:hypothetical protein
MVIIKSVSCFCLYYVVDSEDYKYKFAGLLAGKQQTGKSTHLIAGQQN